MAEGRLNYGDMVLHYTSPEKWKACQRSGFVEPKSVPYYDWERDHPQRGVLAYSPYLVGLLNPGGWNRQGLMDELVVRRASSRSGLMILGVPISEMGWAFVREHALMSPVTLNERWGYDLYGKWVSGNLTDTEKNIVTEARRQYLGSSTPLKEYDGNFECPEIWLPNRTPVDQITVIQDLTGDAKRRKTNRILASAMIAATMTGLQIVNSFYGQYKDQIVTVTPAAALEAVVCSPQEVDLGAVMGTLMRMNDESFRRLSARNGVMDEEPTPEELEQSLDDALPHIASVLRTNRVYRPDIEVVDRLPPETWDGRGMLDLQTGTAIIPRVHPYGSLTTTNSREVVIHEAAHAQAFGGHLFAFTELMYDWNFDTHLERAGYRQQFIEDHAFVELITLEVLARQALEGDDIAEFLFSMETLDRLKMIGVNPSGNINEEEFHHRPAELIMDMLSCRRSDYRGVRIDGIRKLLGRK